MSSTAKRIVLESVGWVLLVVGFAAIFLPGPGLLGIFAGLALLSQQYEWADRRVEPVKLRALKGAAQGVASWPKITLSLLGVAILGACGILWIASPPPPGWWPLSEAWWLPGGMWTGLTQVASAGIAIALIIYSFNRYHGRPDEIGRLDEAIKQADAAARPRKNARQTAG